MSHISRSKQIEKQNVQELAAETVNTPSSWHHAYDQSAYIVISNLNIALTEGDIITVASQYGEVVDIKIIRHHETGISKGIAFLCYLDQRSTILAVDNLNGIELAGRKITVDHTLQYFRRLNQDELVPYLLQQLFGFKPVDTGENRHLDRVYARFTEEEYEMMLELVDQHTRKFKHEFSNDNEIIHEAPKGQAKNQNEGQYENQYKSPDEVMGHTSEQRHGVIYKEQILLQSGQQRQPKTSSESESQNKSRKRKRSKEEREALLREYQEKCRQLRGVEAKKVDGHQYGLATGFDVRHGENRKEISTKDAYEKLHGYGGHEIKSTGRSDVDALEKYAYDMRKMRRDEDLLKRELEEKEKLALKTKRHDEALERRMQQRLHQKK